jgi:hypothetical protein
VHIFLANLPWLSTGVFLYLCQLHVSEIGGSQVSGEDHKGRLALVRGSQAAAQHQERQNHRLPGTHGEGGGVWLQLPLQGALRKH